MFDENPVISRVADNVSRGPVTINGVVNRTGFLVALTTVACAVTWFGARAGSISIGFSGFMAVVGFIVALIIIFSEVCSPALISFYALCEGAMLGTIGYFIDMKYPGA